MKLELNKTGANFVIKHLLNHAEAKAKHLAEKIQKALPRLSHGGKLQLILPPKDYPALFEQIAAKKNPGKTYDLGNNEQVTIGVFKEPDGTFQALTRTKSKYFKTKSGAEKWFLKYGGSAAEKLLNKNPLATRTKHLREAGVIKSTEWLGGNEFKQVKPKIHKWVQRYQEREKQGQIGMQLNPGRLPYQMWKESDYTDESWGIYRQISHKSFFMMGTKKIFFKKDEIFFNIKLSPIKWISIKLNRGSDTYDLTFYKGSTVDKLKVFKKINDVLIDQLRPIIEKETGLYLSLGPISRMRNPKTIYTGKKVKV